MEGDDFPTYGHETRRDAALRYLLERYSPQVRHEAETLMYRVADHVQSLESELLQPLVEALKSLLDSTGEFKLSDAAEAMREATKSLQESADYNQSLLLRGTRSAVQKSAGVASWISMGLLKRLTKEDDLKQRDALLDGLRQAKQAWPEATIVRYAVALGLRYALVLGLVIAVKNAKAENDLARRDALMEELRQLHRAYPEDAAVREQLAKGLVNTQVDAKAENDLARRDALMEDLRQLHRAYPGTCYPQAISQRPLQRPDRRQGRKRPGPPRRAHGGVAPTAPGLP